MSNKLVFQMLVGVVLLAMLAGCAQPAPTTQPAPTQAQPPTAQPTAAPAAPAAGEKVTGVFYWVQNTAWHPVHQLTQLSFLEGCADLGLQCELATTDETSIESLLAMAEQAVSRPDAKGLAMWAGGLPVVKPIIEKAKEKGIWVALPHFPVPEGTFPDNAVQIAADTSKYPDAIAKAMCDQLQGQTGSVAVTENNFNATEDAVAKYFTEGMNKYCPDIKVLSPEVEGPEPTQAIAKAVSIMQANPDLIGALSTTGGGPTTWAGAQKETGKKIVAIGMDYTRVNLDLVNSDQVFAIVAQPLYDECKGAADLLYKMANGEQVPYWTVLDAPVVTKADLGPYYDLLDRMEGKMRPTPTPNP
jgi:ribose transport system substrate-binding protein